MAEPTDAQTAVAAAMIDIAQDDSTLFQLIGGRIHHTEPTQLVDEDTPLIAFRFLPGRNIDYTDKSKSFPVIVQAFSQKSMAEALEVYRAFKTAIKSQMREVDSVHIVFEKEASTPSTNYDEELGDFIATATWRIKAIEPSN